MILFIAGASHTGKTALAQKLLERYRYPYLSIDHLKMGLIRSGQTELTPVSDDAALTAYLWPIVREIVKTAVENRQNLIVEGCYIPFDWAKDFTEEYRKHIRYCCLIMSEAYIRAHFDDVLRYANVMESRLDDADCTLERVLADNARTLEQARQHGVPYLLIDGAYAPDIVLPCEGGTDSGRCKSLIDISQEVFSCSIYPGDPAPERHVLERIEDGSLYNLTGLTLCAHNGTHLDAPYHFYEEGKTVDQLDLSAVIGKCFVSFAEGPLSAEQAAALVGRARAADPEAALRLLIGGNVTVTLEAARVFAREGVRLVGNESQTVGPLNAPAAVHYELLKAEVVLLEGIRLSGVREGVYLLNAAPLNLGGSDGAPCRAVLMEQ